MNSHCSDLYTYSHYDPGMAVLQPTVPTLRRNGKVASCEPCRRSKLSCDHATPVCGRCQRRRVPDRCVYHPAPMANKTTQRRPSLHGSGSSNGNRSSAQSSESIMTTPESFREPAANEQTPSTPSTAGYLGSTSFLDSFCEDTNGELDRNHHMNIRGVSQSTQAPDRSSSKTREGVELLRTFVEMANYPSALERQYKIMNLAPFLPLIHRCIDMVYTRSLQYPSSLLDLSYKMGLRTATPTSPGDITTLQRFADFFLGDGLCWEVLGFLFAIGGISAMSVDEVNELDDQATDTRWKDLATRLLSAGGKCIEFCNDYGHLNTLGFHLRIMVLQLHTQVHGDAG